MPTWPAESFVPVYSCSPFGVLDPVLRMDTDQGYSVRRSRYSRSRRLYQVVYWDTAHLLQIITDFIEREIRGGALSFAWTYPYPMAITSISAATPNVLLTPWVHGLQTGDSVVITGTATHNGIYSIVRVNLNNFQLVGTAAGIAEGAVGRVAAYFPFMSLQLENDSMPIPELMHSYGAFKDNDSLARLTLLLREEFG